MKCWIIVPKTFQYKENNIGSLIFKKYCVRERGYLEIVHTPIKYNIIRYNFWMSLLAKFWFLSFQTLHFMYGLGAFLSPLVAEPFLQNKDCSEIVEDSESNQMTEDEIKALSDVKKKSTVGDAYWVYALLQVSYCHFRSRPVNKCKLRKFWARFDSFIEKIAKIYDFCSKQRCFRGI